MPRWLNLVVRAALAGPGYGVRSGWWCVALAWLLTGVWTGVSRVIRAPSVGGRLGPSFPFSSPPCMEDEAFIWVVSEYASLR